MPTYSNDILSTVLQTIHDKATMGLYRRSNFLRFAKKAGGIKNYSGGYSVQVPVETTYQTGITQISDGYELIDASHGNTLQKMDFRRGMVTRQVSISDKEKLESSGQDAMVDLIQTYHESALQQLTWGLNKQILAGNETGFSEFGTLNGCTMIGVAGGFLEDHAVGSMARTIGGLAKGSVPGLNNQWSDIGGDFATNGLNSLRLVQTQAELYSQADGAPFDLIILHPTTYNLLQAANFTQLRYVDIKDLDAGHINILWNGMPVVADAAFSGLSNTSNGPLSGYCLNFSGVKLDVHKDADFKATPFLRAQNQAAEVAQIELMGGLVAYSLASQAVLTNGNA